MRLSPQFCARYLRRYIQRQTFQGYRYRCPVRGWITVNFRNAPTYYGEDRPWTDNHLQANRPGKNLRRIWVEPIKEWNIFYGDRVECMVGKDKGKQGLVNTIIKERNWVYVEGVNCEFQMKSASPGLPITAYLSEKPLLYPSQVKLVDPSTEAPTEIEWRFTEKGERVRVSVMTGRIIPLPAGADIQEDLVIPAQYKENEAKDTMENDLTEITFKPKPKTFEADIMDQMGITEDRKYKKTYWY